MKNILIITTIQNTVEAFLIPHIKLLQKMGYKIYIASRLTRSISEELMECEWIDINFSRNPLKIIDLIKSYNQLRLLMDKIKFEKVHVHTPIASFVGRYAAYKANIPEIIYTAHGFHFYKGAPLLNWLIYYPIEKLAMRWTDKLITINEEDYKRAISMKGQRTKIYKVNGVGLDIEKYQNGDGEKIKKELKIKKNEFIIAMIGELNKNKNQIQLLKAVNILNKQGVPNIRILLIGLGNQENRLKEFVKKEKIKVDFLGYRKDIKDIIAASDLLCSMSYREGLPRNIMEGMAQGKPIIASNIRGNRDLIKNKKNGFLIKNKKNREIAKKIKNIIEDKKILDKILRNNLIEVINFSTENILKDMKLIYFSKDKN